MTQKKTVLVTGGNGFIGTNLIRLLVASGEYHVINLDALTYAANPLSLGTWKAIRIMSSSRATSQIAS